MTFSETALLTFAPAVCAKFQ